MKNLSTKSFLIGLLSLFLFTTIFTSCQKEAIVEPVVTQSLEEVVNDRNDFCHRLQPVIIQSLDNLIFELRRFRCGITPAETATLGFDIYVRSLENILGIQLDENLINANPNGGGCNHPQNSGPQAAVDALDFLGCRIGTYLNNPTEGTWEDVITAFEFYLGVLETVFGCDWNIEAYRHVLEADC